VPRTDQSDEGTDETQQMDPVLVPGQCP